jgi:ribosome-associated protein
VVLGATVGTTVDDTGERRQVPATERAIELAQTAAQAAADKKAQEIIILDVADQLVITDAFLLASAPNERQVLAISDAIQESLLELPEKAKPVRREGERAGRWVLLDYIDIVVHVQHTEEREYYALDRLWKDCPTIPFHDRDLQAVESGTDPVSGAGAA